MIETDIVVDSGLKLTCSRDELTQRLAVIARGVSTRASVLVLTGILLRAENGKLALAATDMELSLRSEPDAEVEGEGAAAVARRGHPGARVAAAHAPRRGLGRARAGRPREPRRLRRRRVVADDAADRGPVPELQAAPAGDVRARGPVAARRDPRGRPP